MSRLSHFGRREHDKSHPTASCMLACIVDFYTFGRRNLRWVIKRRNMNGGEPMLLLIFYHRRAASVANAGRVGRY